LLPSKPDYVDLGYSPAIDGLRAIAVLSVVAYHACSFVLPAGLLGVDIFFVISGFVVSASVLSHTFTRPGELLAFFFARRILRIVPALLVCLLVTTAATIAFIPEGYLSDTNLHTALFSLFGMSNIVLYHATDNYFAPRAELNPFTHTWSLAVEEQFYLLFPLLTAALLFAFPRRRSRTATILAWNTLTAASVAVSMHQSYSNPVAAFYLSPARFWELGTGVVAYLLLPQILQMLSRIPREAVTALAVAALVGVALSLMFAKSWAASYPFPSVVPTALSTALLLVAVVAHPGGGVAATLAQPPVAYVGRISYSLYLWHWPVFVLMRWTVGFASPIQWITGVLLSSTLAMVSYHWVEVPIRSVPWRRTRRLTVIGAGLATLCLAAGSVYWATAHQRELSASVTADRYVWRPEGSTKGIAVKCGLDLASGGDAEVRMDFSPNNCAEAASRQTIFVVGDSHAGAMIRDFIDAGVSRGITTHIFSRPGCGVLTLSRTNASFWEACDGYIRRTFEQIAHAAKPGDMLFLPSLRLPRLIDVDGGPTTAPAADDERASIAAALTEAEATLEPFDGTGLAVVFSAPLPVFRTLPYRCADWFNAGNPACGSGDIKRAEIDALRSGVMVSLQRLQERFPFVSVWDPVPALCDAQTCSTMKDGKPLFFDGDHLSGWGDDVVYPSLIAFIDSALQATNAPPLRHIPPKDSATLGR
jgi:peptidoglycan/LPS O-acetylase OafA/YrhL